MTRHITSHPHSGNGLDLGAEMYRPRVSETPPEVSSSEAPSVLKLVMSPLVGLVYLIFLPFIGFVLFFGVVLEAVGVALRPVGLALVRAARPTWQPTFAFLARRRRRREDAKPDPWAEQVRKELDDSKDDSSEGRDAS